MVIASAELLPITTARITSDMAGTAALQPNVDLTQHVTRPSLAAAATTTTVRTFPSPSVLDETVSLEATVHGSSGGVKPSGIVSLYGDGALLNIQVLPTESVVGMALPTLSIGTHVFTATYSGDSTFAPSISAPWTHNVQQTGVRLGLQSEAGFEASFAFEVVTMLGPAADGSVTVSDGTLSCTAEVVVGHCTIAFPTAGLYRLTATYIGNAILESNVSAPFDYIVRRFPADIGVTVTPSWIDAGQTLTVTIVLRGVTAILQSPSGVVTVRVGEDAPVCSMQVHSTATCTFAPTSRYPINIDYSGDTYYEPSSVIVRSPVRVTTHIRIGVTPNPVRSQQVITLTGALSSDGVNCVLYTCAPTGQVYYHDNGKLIATAGVHPRVGAVFPITTTFTMPGTHIITGSYSGDFAYTPSVSAPIAVEVVPQQQYLPLVAKP
jgi:hypothetical protein